MVRYSIGCILPILILRAGNLEGNVCKYFFQWRLPNRYMSLYAVLVYASLLTLSFPFYGYNR